MSMKGKSRGIINTAHGKKRTKAHEDDENQNTSSGMVVGSDLPDLAVYQILSLFPTRLAARTSILSKQWRRLWSSVPVIDLDKEEQPCDNKTQRTKFMYFVKSYLKLRERDGCCIDKFRLRMRYLGGPVTINKWLSFAGERNVKELDICFKRRTNRMRSFGQKRKPFYSSQFGQKCKPFSLSQTVLVKSAKSLTILKLENVILKADRIDLPCLKTMSLTYVEFRTDLAFLPLLSGCPSVEYLLLSRCTCPSSHLKLSSSSLKSLEVMSCPEIIFKVEAVNLESLRVHCIHDIPFLKDISSIQNIKSLDLGYTQLRSSWFVDLDSRLPLLESLILHECHVAASINISSQHLKRFVIFDKLLPYDLSINFPNLLEAVIILWFKVPSIWTWVFHRLRDFLESFDCCRKISLHVAAAEIIIIPEDIRKESSPPLPTLKHLEVEIRSYTGAETQSALMDSLRWMAPSSLEFLSIKQISLGILFEFEQRKLLTRPENLRILDN